MRKILNKLGEIRDDIYATYFGIRLGIHLVLMRDVSKAIDDLFKVKRYFIEKRGTYTIQDHLAIMKMLDALASRNPSFGFEVRLMAQGFDLDEAEELKKEFGLL